jgi:hypothetical protein
MVRFDAINTLSPLSHYHRCGVVVLLGVVDETDGEGE